MFQVAFGAVGGVLLAIGGQYVYVDAETGDFRYDEPVDYVPEGWERSESKNSKGVYFYRNRTSGAILCN